MNYTYLDAQLKETPQLTKYASTHLKHQLNFGGTLQIIQNLNADFSISYRDRVGNYQAYDFVNMQFQENPYKAVILANTKLRYERKVFSLFIDGLNLFDQKYYEYGVLQHGIFFKTGIIINL